MEQQPPVGPIKAIVGLVEEVPADIFRIDLVK